MGQCYELLDTDTQGQAVYAAKIVPQSQLVTSLRKQRLMNEIEIHRSLAHPHIVGFHDFFENKNYVYILLHLCRQKTLRELHEKRKTLTEPEVRYFLKQIVLAVQHLHNQKVIHCDLKLGNLFLNDDLEVKLGDSNHSTRVEVEGERKHTLCCGTPIYIAPEFFSDNGYSYELDIWSIGCILYTLLVGKHPFEAEFVEDIWQRIMRNDYHVPSHISPEARILIKKLLHPNPSTRPTPADILNDPFLTSGYMPTRLPQICHTIGPEMVALQQQGVPPENTSDSHLLSLLIQLSVCIDSRPAEKTPDNYGDAEDPASVPIFWVSRWVVDSDTYAIGYQLCDNSVGVWFNDYTRLLLGADGESVQYINRNLCVEFTLSSPPVSLNKKVTLLKKCWSYMSENLLEAGGSAGERPIDKGLKLPYLRAWFRTRSAIILHLSNGTLQINFQDHTKIIICPLMSVVSYISDDKSFRNFRLPLIGCHGCSKELYSRLRYGKMMTERLIAELDSQSSKVSTENQPTPRQS